MEETDYQLGVMIGEYIFYKYLPTLSTDIMRSRIVIKVSEDDTAEQGKLTSAWLKTYNGVSGSNNENWIELRKHDISLRIKYLPKKLYCYLPIKLDLTKNLSDVKKGISDSLWDCDVCSYHADPEQIIMCEIDESGFEWGTTVITLDLDMHEHEFKENS